MLALGLYKRYNSRRRKFTWPAFSIDESERRQHLLVLGKSGMGKSTFLLNSALQDIRSGRGCILIDPKGDTALNVLERIPTDRIKDVIYFAPFDLDYPVGFNPLESVEPHLRSRVASSVLSSFHDLH